tara:strand:+ start:1344 stop:2018 length:675 start_codon:yes stop_codon:yes gene_type:complete
MTYGLKVLNGNNRYLINSDENFSTIVKTSSGTVTGTSFNYPSGVVFGDLFFVRLPSTGFVAENLFTSGTRSVYSTVSTGKNWLKAEVMAGNVSGHTSGYGLNVFNTSGEGASNLLFSSVPGDSLDVVAVGTYGSIGAGVTSKTYTINSSEPHYVLIPGSYYFAWAGASSPVYVPSGVVKKGYTFNYTSTYLNTIVIETNFSLGGASPQSLSYGDQSYMIVRLRS